MIGAVPYGPPFSFVTRLTTPPHTKDAMKCRLLEREL